LKKNWKKDYFNSIDELPIWNWWKCSESGNLIYLRKNSNYEGEDYSAFELWEDLNNQYFEEYGIGIRLIELMKLKKKWIIKKVDYLVNNNRFALTELDIIEAQMQDNADSGSTVKNSDTIIFLEEKLGFPLDVKKTSVKKYYDYINYYK
jgi:hypothetical protein